MEDAPKEDALPLLAFALQRLWRQYSASGALTKDNDDKVGGLRGLIEDAAERALRGISPDEDVALPSGPPTKRRVDLAASTFVPGLAQINDQGATVRRIAAWNDFNEEQQELLAQVRSMAARHAQGRRRRRYRRGCPRGAFSRMDPAEGLARARTGPPRRAPVGYKRRRGLGPARRARVWLDHRGRRLRGARALINDTRYRHQFGRLQKDYLEACAAAGRVRVLRFGGLLMGILVAAAAAAAAVDNKLTYEALIARPISSINARISPIQTTITRRPFASPWRQLPGAALFDWGNARDCVGLSLSAPECALRLTGVRRAGPGNAASVPGRIRSKI